METFGYIYVLRSIGWKENVYKVGSTINPKERISNLQSGNPEIITFIRKYCLVLPTFDHIKQSQSVLLMVEHKIHKLLSEYHYYTGGGTEFFLHTDLEVFLGMIQKIITNISGDIKLIRDKDSLFETIIDVELPIYPNIDLQSQSSVISITNPKVYFPDGIEYREYQIEAVKAIANPIGKFILPPGTGKTVIMMLMSSYFNKNLILVPYLLLISQIKDSCDSYWRSKGYETYYVTPDNKREIKITDKMVIVSTYQSSIHLTDIAFNAVFCDEAHHLTVENDESFYRCIFNKKNYSNIYFFTATEKNKKLINGAKEYEFSMDHPSFGPTLFKYTVDKAIKDGYLNNYNIIFHIYKDDNDNEAKKLIALNNVVKGIHCGNRILVKTNRLHKIDTIIELLRTNYPGYMVESMIARTSESDRNLTMDRIRNHTDKSILVICEVGGEGWNEPCIDTVIMYDVPESEIKMIQVSGRTWRIHPGKQNSNIILLLDRQTYMGKGKKIKRIYRSILKSNPILEQRIIKVLKAIKTLGEKKKCLLPILSECEDGVDYEEVYNSDMELLDRDYTPEMKFVILLKQVEESKEVPHRYHPDIGYFWQQLEETVRKRLSNVEIHKYQLYIDKWIEILRTIPILWNKIAEQKLIKPQGISVMEKVRTLIEFVTTNGVMPSQSAPGDSEEHKLAKLWNHLQGDIRKNMANEPVECFGIDNLLEVKPILLQNDIINTALQNASNKKKNLPEEVLAEIITFIRTKNRIPVRMSNPETEEDEHEYSLGKFLNILTVSIKNFHLRNGKPVYYKPKIPELTRIFMTAPLLVPKLDDIRHLIPNPVTMIPNPVTIMPNPVTIMPNYNLVII